MNVCQFIDHSLSVFLYMSDQEPRTIVLCFDGSGNQYTGTNTDIVKFFALLKKDDCSKQLCYYQPGIGTWFKPGVVEPIFRWAAKALDLAIAWYLDAHIMDGYNFLMQNYRAGDRVCLFGFSRGSYTARALAGMIHKVGLLLKDNEEQISFAYKLYKHVNKEGIRLSAGFKQTFCRDVKIEFVGVWDTISSVGFLTSKSLPFTSSNSAIKTFRHALALDERRTMYRPNVYQRSSQNDVPDPNQSDGDGPTDALEVWFVGCHGDIGGDIAPDAVQHQLPNITLRWMVREVMASRCGVQFDDQALLRASVPNFNSPVNGTDPYHEQQRLDVVDALMPMHDQLKIVPLWWLLEIIPREYMWQDERGVWHNDWWPNLGRGRKIRSARPLFHVTVEERMADPKLKYKPMAQWVPKTEVYVN